MSGSVSPRLLLQAHAVMLGFPSAWVLGLRLRLLLTWEALTDGAIKEVFPLALAFLTKVLCYMWPSYLVELTYYAELSRRRPVLL